MQTLQFHGRRAHLPLQLLVLFLLLYLLCSSHAAISPIGPLATISIDAESAWSAARSCANTCLAYHGPYPCTLKGHHDLGKELGCSCNPSNACYCSQPLGSSVTSYLSSCVSEGCDSVMDWQTEVTSMLALYNNYCATANVPDAAPQTAATTGGIGSSKQTSDATAGRTPQVTTPTPTQTAVSTAPAPTNPGDQGLKKSDIVALAASLGVGIPSLVIAATTLWIQLRRKRKIAREHDFVAGGGNQ